MGGEHQLPAIPQHPPRLVEITAEIAHMLQHLEGQHQIGAVVLGQEQAVVGDGEVGAGAEVGSAIGHAGGPEDGGVGLGPAAEVEGSRRGPGRHRGLGEDRRVQPAQHQPVAVDDAGRQAPALFRVDRMHVRPSGATTGPAPVIGSPS